MGWFRLDRPWSAAWAMVGMTGAADVVKQTVDATTDEITSELQEALKS